MNILPGHTFKFNKDSYQIKHIWHRTNESGKGLHISTVEVKNMTTGKQKTMTKVEFENYFDFLLP